MLDIKMCLSNFRRRTEHSNLFEKRLPKRDLVLMSPAKPTAPIHVIRPLAKVLLADNSESGVCLPRASTGAPKCPISPLAAASKRVVVDKQRHFLTVSKEASMPLTAA